MRRFLTIFKQKYSNLRSLLFITFPQGFRFSINIGHLTSGSGGKKTLKCYLKSEHTNRQTNTRTHRRTFRLIESIGPEGQCFGKKIDLGTVGGVLKVLLVLMLFAGHWCHPLCVTWHMSCVKCHMSGVRCHISGVTCYISHVTCNSQAVKAREMKFEIRFTFYHMSTVTCHVSRVTFDVSYFFWRWLWLFLPFLYVWI